jgi:hypothetical protein
MIAYKFFTRQHLTQREKTFLVFQLYIPISIIIALFLVECALRVFDPLGMVYYDYNHELLSLREYEDDLLYGFPPGDYSFSRWSFTILPDGTREVSGTNVDADCEVVIIGDSFPFGFGIDDPWVNLIAPQFPECHFINAAMHGYNSAEILARARQFPDADYIIYHIAFNDDAPSLPRANNAGNSFYLARYLAFAKWRLSGDLPDKFAVPSQFEYFKADLAALMSDDRVRLVGMGDDRLTPQVIELGYNVHTFEIGDSVNSAIDNHPSQEGHRLIAEQLLPFFEELLR